MQAGVCPGVWIARRLESAHGKDLVIGKQMVKLAAVRGEPLFGVEYALEMALHVRDPGANADAPTKPGFQKGRGRQMVGMNVGLKDPFHRKAVLAHEIHDAIRLNGIGTPGLGVKVQHRIDDCTCATRRLEKDIGNRRGLRIEECLNLRVHEYPPRLTGAHRES